jgi:hypothetical protein
VVDVVVVRMWLGLLVDQGVSHDVSIIYFLNNQILTCSVSSAGWHVVIQRLKGLVFDSHCNQLFLNNNNSF